MAPDAVPPSCILCVCATHKRSSRVLIRCLRTQYVVAIAVVIMVSGALLGWNVTKRLGGLSYFNITGPYMLNVAIHLVVLFVEVRAGRRAERSG